MHIVSRHKYSPISVLLLATVQYTQNPAHTHCCAIYCKRHYPTSLTKATVGIISDRRGRYPENFGFQPKFSTTTTLNNEPPSHKNSEEYWPKIAQGFSTTYL